MTQEEYLSELLSLLEIKSKAENALIIHEMRGKLLFSGDHPTAPGPKKLTAIDKFIDKYRDEIEDCDIQFLNKSERTSAEVALYLECHPNQIAKWVKEGRYKTGRRDSPRKRTVDTLSVVRHVLGIDDETTTKQKRKL